MGLGSQIVEPLARESAYRPMEGDALLIGRQTVYYDKPTILTLLQAHSLEPQIDPSQITFDRSTIDRNPNHVQRDLISDTSLLRLFGARRVMALDHSAYEDAEIVHDLRYPISDNLANSADVLIDGSTLDNVFTPSVVLQNFTRLLRPGGRMFITNAFSSFESAYVIMPPMWYVDYFVMNGFADCRVYVLLFSEGRSNSFYVDLQEIYDLGRTMGYFPVSCCAAVVAFAEKGTETTYDRLPIQQDYRSESEWFTYRKNLSKMLESKRPHLLRSNSDPFVSDVNRGYRYVNQGFEIDDQALIRMRAA